MAEHIETGMGTRILMLLSGSVLTVTNDEDGAIYIDIGDAFGVHPPKKLRFNQSEALTLVEFLAIAARPGSAKRIIEMPAQAGE